MIHARFVQDLFRRIWENGWRIRVGTEPASSMVRIPKNRCRHLYACCAVIASVAGILGAVAAHAGELNARDLALMDRLTWGINASSAEHLRALGTERWLQEQLHPPADAALPDTVTAQIKAMPDVHKLPFDIAVAFEQQAKSANQVADADQKKAAQQVYQGAMNDRASRRRRAPSCARCMRRTNCVTA
jgi:Protein of unknown function (DUF1800)